MNNNPKFDLEEVNEILLIMSEQAQREQDEYEQDDIVNAAVEAGIPKALVNSVLAEAVSLKKTTTNRVIAEGVYFKETINNPQLGNRKNSWRVGGIAIGISSFLVIGPGLLAGLVAWNSHWGLPDSCYLSPQVVTLKAAQNNYNSCKGELRNKTFKSDQKFSLLKEQVNSNKPFNSITSQAVEEIFSDLRFEVDAYRPWYLEFLHFLMVICLMLWLAIVILVFNLVKDS